ncbi:hypothetical protein LARV_00451 [Longilinea arvoryzae]|uniref:DUF4440 domain-containing protein n=1 Tax=Longilinea arvoryzae TaxID=360412 RepID=A0A0S7BG10_9CHLR|nr:hypothetical protein [Longilinea arvoryzae]GAP12715.1 hypothetical protein LARV_00451 [Longilinea arvoryzae]
MNQETQAIEFNIQSFYGIISGKMTDDRDWSTFRDLFIGSAILSICKKDDQGRTGITSYMLDSYIERMRSFLSRNDFYEYSVGNEIRIYGDIGCICNEYAAYADFEREKFLKQGKNFISMALDGNKWKITSMTWEDGV